MARSPRIATGLLAVALLALGVDRLVLAPLRLDTALDALPRVTLAEAMGPVDTLDYIALLDDRDGWFLIDDPSRAAQSHLGGIGLSGGAHVPAYCGGDRGRIVWGIRDAQIVEEIAFCDPAALDLAALRAQARPIRMERDLLTGQEVEILAAEIAADPLRLPITLPRERIDLPFERIVVLPWVWTGPDDPRDLSEVVPIGAQWLEQALTGHDGAFDIEITPQAGPEAPVAGGGRAPVVLVDGDPAVVSGLSVLIRPVYSVRCTEAACAALDDLSTGDSLDPWRDRSVLDAALAGAAPVSYAGGSDSLADRAALLDGAISVSPALVFRHAVRIARLLADPAQEK